MSLFICDRCHTMDNTALGQYWGTDEKLCSGCDPTPLHGGPPFTWHGRWERFVPGVAEVRRDRKQHYVASRGLTELLAGKPPAHPWKPTS